MVVSNKTGGEGNLTGHISPLIVAIFQFVSDTNVFISTDGHTMTFQSKIGKNDLSFLKGFLEYLLKEEIFDIEGNEYQGLDLKKAYIVKFRHKDGSEGNATMTNKDKLHLTGKTMQVGDTFNVGAHTVSQWEDDKGHKSWHTSNKRANFFNKIEDFQL